MWDMHYTPLNVPPAYPISAIYQNTAPDFTSPWVMPGTYTAKLTVDGKTQTQNFEVVMDPRVKTSKKDLQLQHDLSVSAYNNIQQCMKLLSRLDEQSEKAKAIKKFMGAFTAVHNSLQDSDWAPTSQMIRTAKQTQAEFDKFLGAMK